MQPHPVHGVPAFEDNYIWLIQDRDRRYAAIVDPGDGEPVLAALERLGLEPTAILITHHHYDHTGGISELLSRYPTLPVYGPEDRRISGLTQVVGDGDRVGLDALHLELEVLATPGHTLSHVVYFGAEMLFCGDTLFTGGCGRLFEGTPAQMQHSLARIRALSDATRVYCAHEYTLANLRFARVVEPESPELEARQKEVEALRAANEPTVPASLGLEKATNPFLRYDVPEVIAATERYAGHPLADAAAVFGTVRRWKDDLD